MHEIEQSMIVNAMAMRAQGQRMRVISENIANAETPPARPGEEPYRRQMVTFRNEFDRASGTSVLKVDDVVRDQSEFTLRYNPGHPAADEAGYLQLPNVTSLVEMMDMREAQRSYEANVRMISLSRDILMKTIDMLRPR